MDIFMIIMTIILAIVLIVVNIYLLAYYCHPDDRGFGSALICKFVVVIGMSLSWAQVLMLPLDVSNTRGSEGGIRMDIFWIVIYLTTAVFLVFIIPSLTYYYEADNEWSCWQKIKYSFCYLFVTIIVVIAILIITYVLLSKAEIPITTVNCSIANIQKSDSTDFVLTNCIRASSSITLDVSFPIFVIGLMSFISWFLFVIFGGIGLAALPLDFFYDFCSRPKKISQSELKYLKEKTTRRAKEIEKVLQECKTLESQKVLENGFWNKDKRRYKELLHQSQAGVLVLEKEYGKIQIQKELNDKFTCHYFFLLIVGFLCLLISLAWFIHILLYFIIKINNEPVYPFLNNLLTALVEANVSFLATAFFSIFCLYLLWATIKGNIKFGLRGVSILATLYLLCRPSDINSVDKIYEKKEEEMKLKVNSESQVSKNELGQ